jgi:succinate dehydrogenase / fumarate reductase, flavoprotein subunit
VQNLSRSPSDLDKSIFTKAESSHHERHLRLLESKGGENPYLIHQELGDIMTRAATVVRRNDQLTEAIQKVKDMQQRAAACSLSDTGSWTNQNVIFTKALQDMFPIALSILKGALMRDECRGAHYKPQFAMPSLTEEDPVARRREAERWCDRFEENNRKFLKSSIATYGEGDVSITYEDVDTSLIPPRPRLYGLVGADVIDQVWKERVAKREKSESLVSV